MNEQALGGAILLSMFVTMALIIYFAVVVVMIEADISSSDCPGKQVINITETDGSVEIKINCIPGKGGVYYGG